MVWTSFANSFSRPFAPLDPNSSTLILVFKYLFLLSHSACCFDDVPPNRVSQCQEGHLFCLNCSRRGAEVEIGYQRTVLKCMSPECTSSFSDSEAKRFLSTAVFEGLLRARQQQELK